MKKSRLIGTLYACVFSLGMVTPANAADQTGTNGNDFFFFQGTVQQLTTTQVNAYSGESIFINDQFNINTASYEGLAGIDTLFFTNAADALFIEDPFSGTQMVSNVEVFFAGNGADLINLSSSTYFLGNIVIDGGNSNDIIWANIGNDSLNGRAGNDILDGGPGDDILNGNEGDDILNGGEGDDILFGEIGMNSLDGGIGDDIFRWLGGSPGDDTIFDESGFDVIQFTGTVTFDDLVLQILTGGDLQITAPGSTILIPGQYAGGSLVIEELQFSLDSSSYNLSSMTVPVPAAVWLFGSGVLGLVGIARRKKPA